MNPEELADHVDEPIGRHALDQVVALEPERRNLEPGDGRCAGAAERADRAIPGR